MTIFNRRVLKTDAKNKYKNTFSFCWWHTLQLSGKVLFQLGKSCAFVRERAAYTIVQTYKLETVYKNDNKLTNLQGLKKNKKPASVSLAYANMNVMFVIENTTVRQREVWNAILKNIQLAYDWTNQTNRRGKRTRNHRRTNTEAISNLSFSNMGVHLFVVVVCIVMY